MASHSRTDEGWFTVEPIDETTIAVSEYGHWEQVHSYLVVGEDRAVLIDTGLGVGDLKSVVRRLTDRPIRVVTTHVHWDHVGSHGAFDEISVHEAEVSWLRDGIPGLDDEDVRENLTRDCSRPLPERFDPEAYEVFTGEPTHVHADGETIDLGGRRLEIHHTPGHSPGHCCVLDRDRGYLFAGDLLYRGTLYAFFPSTDPVAFAESVRRVADCEAVDRVLPGHDDLDVPPSFPARVRDAFDDLDRRGALHHGSGTHEFEDFAIRL